MNPISLEKMNRPKGPCLTDYRTSEEFFTAAQVAVVDALNNYESFRSLKNRTKEELAELLALKWKPKDPVIDEAVAIIRKLRSASMSEKIDAPLTACDAVRLGVELQKFLESSRGFEEGEEGKIAHPIFVQRYAETGQEPSASEMLTELQNKNYYRNTALISFAQIYQRWRARWRFWSWLEIL